MPDSAVPPEAVPVEVINKAVRAAGERIGLYKPGKPGFWSTFRIGLEAAAPLIAAAERERLLGAAGCPSPASPDRELAAELFKTIAFIAGPRTPVPHGTWLRESYGAGSVVCEECGRLAADSIEHEHLAGIARDHAAATGHQVIVQASRSALYGPKEESPGV